MAKDNGTVDWIVHILVKAVGGRIALIPWVFFVVTALLSGFGSVVQAAIVIIAPMGMGFSRRYGIRPLLMGLMVINGATAGGFSPLSIFGTITNQVVERNDLPGSPLLFLASFVFNVILGLVCFFIFGGRELLGKRDLGHGLEDKDIDWLGEQVASMGAPLFAALIIYFIGAVVSAFASTTGILGALIPLAVPFLLTGSVSEIGLIIALAISSSVVDSSPFSTSGVLVVANSPEEAGQGVQAAHGVGILDGRHRADRHLADLRRSGLGVSRSGSSLVACSCPVVRRRGNWHLLASSSDRKSRGRRNRGSDWGGCVSRWWLRR